ncbi:MAG: phosphoglycerate dehydrogenase [Acidobacteriota bacterium]
MSTPGAGEKRVLVADRISPSGLELLSQGEGFQVRQHTGLGVDELKRLVREHDALVVRSATRVPAEVLEKPGRLKVIGRAGTGVDNIDLEAATRAGVVVMNAPGGNSVAAAELTFSLLLALARSIPQANQSLRAGRWERKSFMGTEVAGKSLGLIGLGRIGKEVARRAQGFGMEVLAYDPYVSPAVAEDMGLSLVDLGTLLSRADFVSLHLPLTKETQRFMNAENLRKMKAGARLINCARGELLDEDALLAALESGRIRGAALDVFESEPPSDRRLVDHPLVVSTPHLGASTLEAQERVSREIAGKIREFLETGAILDAVNFPSVSREDHAVLGPMMNLAERLGSFLSQVTDGGARALQVRCYGDFTQRPLRPVMMAAVKGLLSPYLADVVSYVNALSLARERGITVEEGRSNEATPYAGLLRLILTTDSEHSEVAGTLFTSKHPRLVEVNHVEVECNPRGNMLFFRNRDVPGVVGRIGSILGKAGVNIGGIRLGRAAPDGMAVSIVNVDTAVPEAALRRIQALPEITLARSVKV